MAVRLNADWMRLVDDRILEYLDEEGPGAPANMEKDNRMQFSKNYLNRRLILLRKAGLVELIGNGVYRITPDGRGYLAGREDLRNAEDPDKASEEAE